MTDERVSHIKLDWSLTHELFVLYISLGCVCRGNGGPSCWIILRVREKELYSVIQMTFTNNRTLQNV